MLTTLCQCRRGDRSRKGLLKNLYMPKASTQDGLDEGILEASLTIFPTMRKESWQTSPTSEVCAIKEVFLEWAKETSTSQPVTIHMSGPLPCLLFPLLPLFPAYSQHLPVYLPCPTHLLATLPSHPAAGPSLGEKEPPLLGCYPHQGFTSSFPTCHLSLPTSHTPHKGNTQTHTHTHMHTHTSQT